MPPKPLKKKGGPKILCEALMWVFVPVRSGLVPVLERFGCALARLAGLSARGCSVGRVLVDLLWAPGINGAPSAEGRSLNTGTTHSL